MYESYAIIGVWGAKRRSALEDKGKKLVELEVGDPEIIDSRLIEIQKFWG
ncbi:MAG: hypothetical protein R3A13_11860 [Bdellovibrionota bacterium]